MYSQLTPFSEWLVGLLAVDRHSQTGETLAFFAYDTPKVLLLLALIVFAMGIVRSFFSPEHTRALLAGKREGVGNAAAAMLGVVTRSAPAQPCRSSSASSRPVCLSV